MADLGSFVAVLVALALFVAACFQLVGPIPFFVCSWVCWGFVIAGMATDDRLQELGQEALARANLE